MMMMEGVAVAAKLPSFQILRTNPPRCRTSLAFRSLSASLSVSASTLSEGDPSTLQSLSLGHFTRPDFPILNQVQSFLWFQLCAMLSWVLRILWDNLKGKNDFLKDWCLVVVIELEALKCAFLSCLTWVLYFGTLEKLLSSYLGGSRGNVTSITCVKWKTF